MTGLLGSATGVKDCRACPLDVLASEAALSSFSVKSFFDRLLTSKCSRSKMKLS